VALAMTVAALLVETRARADDASQASNDKQKVEQNQPAPDARPCEHDRCFERCRCRDHTCCTSSCNCRTPSVSLSVTGVRASMTRIATPGATSSSLGLAVAGGVESYALDGTTHGALQFALGGGEAGFEGMLAGQVDLGYRIDVTDNQGPFGRAGFDGRMQGNDKLYFSSLELPRLTLGWQYLSGRMVVEAGARGGPILAGRYNPGDEGYRRLSGSLEYGGFASVQLDFVRVDLTAMRIDARNTGNGRPVDVGRGSLCALAGKVGICADIMVLRGEADMGPNAGGIQTAMSSYAGITLGVASF
jgi:hypothetical protein